MHKIDKPCAAGHYDGHRFHDVSYPMRRTLADVAPWIAVALAIAVAVAYFALNAPRERETYDDCLARQATPDDTDATRALNRASCANKPRDDGGPVAR